MLRRQGPGLHFSSSKKMFNLEHLYFYKLIMNRSIYICVRCASCNVYLPGWLEIFTKVGTYLRALIPCRADQKPELLKDICKRRKRSASQFVRLLLVLSVLTRESFLWSNKEARKVTEDIKSPRWDGLNTIYSHCLMQRSISGPIIFCQPENECTTLVWWMC